MFHHHCRAGPGPRSGRCWPCWFQGAAGCMTGSMKTRRFEGNSYWYQVAFNRIEPAPCRCAVAVHATLLCAPRLAQQRCVRAGRSASLERSALRSDCPAMLGLAAPPPNSLRSLCSLRSNSRGESVVDPRFARGPQALRFSALQRRAAACPNAPLRITLVVPTENHRCYSAAGGAWWGRFLWRRASPVQSERNTDRHSMSPRRAPPAEPY